MDPGFQGRLKFSVYNAGSRNAVFDPLEPLFQVWFSTMTESEDDASAYNGTHNNQESITAGDVENLQGNILSPATLAREITDIKLELRYYRALGALAVTVFIAALIIPAYKWAGEYWNGSRSMTERPTVNQPAPVELQNENLVGEQPAKLVEEPRPSE